MTINFTFPIALNQLGWKAVFQQQLTLEDYEQPHLIGRVIAHHKSGYQICTENALLHLAHHHSQPPMTVGDWVLLDEEGQRLLRLLERSSLFSRRAPGPKLKEQYIAANVDTVFVVCSLNHDFNLSRIERYLSLANEAGSEAVVVLTKADLHPDPDSLRAQVQALDPMLVVESVNALDDSELNGLRSWCGTGQTVAFVGSSGVGKSTLVNTLSGHTVQETGAIREDDSKGRHTTTSRTMVPLPEGGLLLDTPGMRELQLSGAGEGVSDTFQEIEALAEQCRFSDCRHQGEPGCAVTKAMERGELDQRRLDNYHKLLREEAHNNASLAEKREASRQFGKMCRNVMAEKQARRKG